MHWPKFVAEYRTQTRICLDIWQYNYVITILGKGGFSSDCNKNITEIKFCGCKHGMSLSKSQCSPYAHSLVEKLQSIEFSTFI